MPRPEEAVAAFEQTTPGPMVTALGPLPDVPNEVLSVHGSHLPRRSSPSEAQHWASRRFFRHTPYGHWSVDTLRKTLIPRRWTDVDRAGVLGCVRQSASHRGWIGEGKERCGVATPLRRVAIERMRHGLLSLQLGSLSGAHTRLELHYHKTPKPKKASARCKEIRQRKFLLSGIKYSRVHSGRGGNLSALRSLRHSESALRTVPVISNS
jgi:hypothetical protein